MYIVSNINGMYVIVIDKAVQPDAYTSLVAICKAYGLGYEAANRGKRVFVKDSTVLELVEVRLVKIRGRGKKQF